MNVSSDSYLPNGADGHGSEPGSEAQGLLPGVKHETDEKVITQPRSEMADSSEVLISDGGRGLHVDRHHLPAFVL